VLVLHRLDEDALRALLVRAEEAIGPLPLTPEARERMVELADGDGRALIGMAEQVARADAPLDPAALARRIARRAAQYDKSGDAHFDLISALHKSVRGSDPDAALYCLCRMLEGGEDPRYLGRRITRMAVEDVGLADPQAPAICLAAWETYERLGSPEGEQALANAVLHLALAPKSNAAYAAYKAAREAARTRGSDPPPKHIRNAPTRLMREQGLGAGYEYDHDVQGGVSGQDYFPDGMDRPRFYAPLERGHERELRRRVDWLDGVRARRRDRAAGEGG
jgi:putative ATPase